MEPGLERLRLRVGGTVQGVGFRPFVHRLAARHGITGRIGNDRDGVWCEVQGPRADVRRFLDSLGTDAPPLARVGSIDVQSVVPISGEATFVIEASDSSPGAFAMSIPPDVAMCAACRREISEPDDRRRGYAFTCCADCGPRFTVVQSLPYDRERTSMVDFPMCAECASEYSSVDDRRFHAQATCCPSCGPSLMLLDDRGCALPGDPIAEASAMLDAGRIVAVKGVGGFQLMCRADDDGAVSALRKRKHRDAKPFALLAGSIEHARTLLELDDLSTRALTGPEAPIVLAPAATGADIADSVAPGIGQFGVMLPATPLHALIAARCSFALVCTSGNRSDEPIVVDEADAFVRLGDIADAFVTHDRRIERRADDSVGHVVSGRFQLLRRARGFAPRPVRLTEAGPPVLGVGAELKNAVCLAVGNDAHVSVHLGDLEHPRTVAAFEAAIADQLAMAGVNPELVVHDMHPEYVSTKFATAQDFGPTLAVQHHHAHLASCLTDNLFDGPAIGVTFDGLGWGTDDTLWGGEFLIGDATGVRRAGHLAPVAMPGMSQAIRQPWRMAVAHLVAAYGDSLPTTAMTLRNVDRVGDVVGLCPSAIRTSSMGRLFDAVAALCDLADEVSFEGQAAIRLEQCATDTSDAYEWTIDEVDGVLVIDPAAVVAGVVDDRRAGLDVGMVSGKFHRAVAVMIADACARLRTSSGLTTVALSGGVFQNRRLVEILIPMLDAHGLTTLHHSQVPPNDGGISLGQVAVGRAHLG